jgi:hypothetical protein
MSFALSLEFLPENGGRRWDPVPGATSVDVPRPQQTEPTPLTYRPEAAIRGRGVSQITLYRMIAKGDLNAYKLWRTTVIRHDDLVKLVESLEPVSGTKAAQCSGEDAGILFRERA